MKYSLLFCCVLALSVSCKKEQVPIAHSRAAIVPCSESKNWTAESAGKALVGNWLLYRWEVNGAQQNVLYRRLSFYDGKLFLSFSHAGSTLLSEYTVEKSGSDLIVRTTDSTDLVAGILYLCDDYLIFSSSAVDGPDYYYERD